MNSAILRIDDIGASSKYYEQYGRIVIKGQRLPMPFVNIGPIKRQRFFRGWGPYREMRSKEWHLVYQLLTKYKARLTVCVTASWVEINGSLTPFTKKFPEEAGILKKGLLDGHIEIGNHGLTHCVVGHHLPRFWSGNRAMHREFWPSFPDSLHDSHLKQSQDILQNFFGAVTTFTPPGNQWTDATEQAAVKRGLKVISAQFPDRHHVMKWANQHPVYAFHDREIVLYGVEWFENLLKTIRENNHQAKTVRELYG